MFPQLSDSSLQANRRKFKFGVWSIAYLGHLITRVGIKTLTDDTYQTKWQRPEAQQNAGENSSHYSISFET